MSRLLTRNRALVMVGIAILTLAIGIYFQATLIGYVMLLGHEPTNPREVIDTSPDAINLEPNQLGTDWEQTHHESNESHSRVRLANTDGGIHGWAIEIIDSDIWVYESIEAAESSYDDRYTEIQSEYNNPVEINLGHEGVMYKGTSAVYVTFRDSNVIATVGFISTTGLWFEPRTLSAAKTLHTNIERNTDS